MIKEIESVRRAISSICNHGGMTPDINAPHGHDRMLGEIVANALSSLDRIEGLVRSIQDFSQKWDMIGSASSEDRWGLLNRGIIEQDIANFDFDIDQYRESIGGPTVLKETRSKEDLMEEALDISEYEPRSDVGGVNIGITEEKILGS